MLKQIEQEKLNEVEANSENWLKLYKQYLDDGYHVRLKHESVNGKIKLSIVYWR